MNFWTKFAEKVCVWSKTEKSNIAIEFNLFQLSELPNFSLNRQFRYFKSNLPKKNISSLKQKK